MKAEPTENARYFNENGFMVLPGMLPEPEVAAVSDEIDRIITGAVHYIPPEFITYEPGSSPPRVRNVFHVHRYNPLFMDIARNPGIVNAVEAILGGPVRLYSSQLFAKPAGVGTRVPLHQDMPYWPFEPYEMLSCWIALDDSTIENGCVRFLAGSHKLGLLHHAPSGVQGNSLGLEDARVAGLEERAVEAPRGTCVLHHCLTVHWSEPNRSPRPRRGLIFVYMSPQVRVTDAGKLKGVTDFPVVSAGEGRP